MEFIEMLEIHKKNIETEMNKIVLELVKRSQEHDNDKIFDMSTNQRYKDYFPGLKKIEYGTKEYHDYEIKHFDDIHQKHAQNRHHFYSSRNKQTDPNLIDLIEAVIDIYVSNKQYNENFSIDAVMNVIKKKEIDQVDLEQVILNTITLLEERNDY